MEKPDRLYTTIGTVQQYLTDHLKRERQRLTFLNALVRLHQAGALVRSRPVTPMFNELLGDVDFIRAVYQIPVNAAQVASSNQTHVIEDEVFPVGNDVFSFCYLHDQDDPPHEHDFFEVTYVYKGGCLLEFESETRALQTGDLCIVAPHAMHTNLIEPDDFAISLLIRSSTFIPMFWNLLAKHDLLSTFFRNSLRSAREANYILFHTENTADLKHMIQRIVWESSQVDDYSNSYAVSMVNLLFITVLRQYAGSAMFFRIGEEMAQNLDTGLLTQFIQKNYQTVTLASLAETFHYSEAYLSRVIQENLGKKFTELVRSLKLSHAIEYLSKTELKINDIAELVGYSSADHFTRVFKEKYKMSPQEFRRINLK
jgi:AraC-like DNA-binding protein/quercetin dioxygenase-like cupin family protein